MVGAAQHDVIPAELPGWGWATRFHRPAGTGRSYWGPGDVYTFLVTGLSTVARVELVHYQGVDDLMAQLPGAVDRALALPAR